MTVKVLISERTHNRQRCPMADEDLAAWCMVARGKGKFWAALLTNSIRQDHIDCRIMTLMTEGLAIFKKAMALITPTLHEETIQ